MTKFRHLPAAGRAIIVVVAIGVLAIAVVACATSYNAIYRLVGQLGLYGYRINQAFPLMLDAAFLVAELAAILGGIMRAVTRSDEVTAGWPGAAMLLCGLGTIGFNVGHAYLIGGRGDPLTVWRCVVAALPPILMMVSFQVLIAIVKWVMLHLGRPLNSAAALTPTQMPYGLAAPGPSGWFPPHPVFGQVPSVGQQGVPQNGHGELPEPTKRAAVEMYLSQLGPQELGVATGSSVVAALAGQGDRGRGDLCRSDPGGVAGRPPGPHQGPAQGRPVSLIRLGPGELLAALGELDCAGAARVYAALGFPVVPMHTPRPAGGCSCPDQACPDLGKHPRLRGWKRLAAADAAVVGEWWRRWPQANLALVTGRRFDVLDLDGDQGVEALHAVLSIAPTEHPGPVARTGGGGWHLLYAPTGLGNRVGLLAGVDWRGQGGLIVAPPSQHASGHGYTWARPLTATLPEVPAGLQRLLAPPAAARTTLPPAPAPAGQSGGYGRAALAGEQAAVAAAQPGCRNQTLNRAAFNLGQLVAAGLLDANQVRAELLAAALEAGNPEAKARATIESGLAGGAAKPRRGRPREGAA